MKKILYFIILLITVTAFTGCSHITEGEIIDKSFTEAHTEIRYIPIVTSNGKTSTTRFQPYFYSFPDTWRIKICGTYNGEYEEATFRVSKEVYDATPLGAQFIYKEEYTDYQEYTREKQ